MFRHLVGNMAFSEEHVSTQWQRQTHTLDSAFTAAQMLLLQLQGHAGRSTMTSLHGDNKKCCIQGAPDQKITCGGTVAHSHI